MKEKFIEVYDDLIPEFIQNYLYNLIMGSIPNTPFPLYISSNLSGGERYDLGFNNHFTHYPKHKDTILQVLYYLSIFKKINIQSIYINRVFLQVPLSPSFTPKKHNDLSISHLVCLYYVNDSDGDTIFYNDSNKEIQRVSPKKGRIALFDGSILHSAGIPTKNERIVINICFNGEFYE